MADDEAYAKKAVESLKVVEVAYDVAADPQGYFKVFKQFDADRVAPSTRWRWRRW